MLLEGYFEKLAKLTEINMSSRILISEKCMWDVEKTI